MKLNFKHFMTAIMLVLCCSVSSFATENGQIMYPIGVNTVLNGILPAPGQTMLLNYMQYYSADTLNDSDGNSTLPDFNVDVFVEALRVLHTWERPLGPFTVTSGFVLPVVYLDMDLGLGFPGTSDSAFGLGDITLQPLNIGYSNASHTLFTYLALDLAVPTGSYSENDLANVGSNHYAFQPSLSVTWFATPKLELSGTALLEYDFENKDTDYQSGISTSFEYNAGYMVTDKLQLGLQGFFLTQISDDEVDGEKYLDGHRSKVNAIGPQLRYNLKSGSALVLKWQHEFGAENRTEGDRVWLQFAMPL